MRIKKNIILTNTANSCSKGKGNDIKTQIKFEFLVFKSKQNISFTGKQNMKQNNEPKEW